MLSFFTLTSLLTLVSAQAVTDLIVPSSTPPAGCLNSRDGTFNLNILNATGFNTSSPTPSRRSFDAEPIRDFSKLMPRQLDGILTLTLRGGILTDQANRTGYIASNYQFQFDNPVQAGAIYTAGWGVCGNGSLSLGGQAVFWQCLSGDFYNLYDRNFAAHCLPIYFGTYVASGSGDTYSTSPPGPITTGPDQNTIASGGGTQSTSSTSAAASSSAAASTEASATDSASAAATSASAAASSATESAATTQSAAGVVTVEVTRHTLGWLACIIIGAAVLA